MHVMPLSHGTGTDQGAGDEITGPFSCLCTTALASMSGIVEGIQVIDTFWWIRGHTSFVSCRVSGMHVGMCTVQHGEYLATMKGGIRN